MKTKIKIATIEDAELIKNFINEMYGFEYETRSINEIQADISKKFQIYTLAYIDEKPIGFAGATTNSNEYIDVISSTKTVLEYVYVKEEFRGLFVALELMRALIEQLVKNNQNSAIMQVQTFNKQRFLHYALSDKNIVKTIHNENKDYNDEILLIRDLKRVLSMSQKEFLIKVREYSRQGTATNLNT